MNPNDKPFDEKLFDFIKSMNDASQYLNNQNNLVYPSYLAFSFIRAFRGDKVLDDINITPEDIASIKIISDSGMPDGRHVSFKFKDKLYTMEIRVVEPKTLIVHPEIKKIDNPLMCEDLLEQGGI